MNIGGVYRPHILYVQHIVKLLVAIPARVGVGKKLVENDLKSAIYI
jgi:hypothetical protein